MPKGIPAAKPKSILERLSKQLVPPGAKVFPGSETPATPEGVALPDGIRIRTDRGVELRFYNDGQRISETVRGRPTVAYVMEVSRKRDRIQQLIGLGKFSEAEYAEEFPDSPRLKKEKVVEQVMTVGQALDDWFASRAGTVGQNTERDYELAIRNQLKPFKFMAGTVNPSDFMHLTKDGKADERLQLERHLGGPARRVDPLDHQVLGQLPLTLLSDMLINTVRQQMLADGLSVKRVKNLMAPLSGAVTRQVKLKALLINPFDLVEPLKDRSVPLVKNGLTCEADLLDAPLPGSDMPAFMSDEGDPDPFSIDEMNQIIGQCDAAMAQQFAFAFWTGLRTGELIALRRSDLQLDQNRFLVRRSLSRGVLKTTKTDKPRWVDLLPPAKQALKAHLALFNAPDGWVFPNPFTLKRWQNESKITKRWMRALERAGVRYRRPYQTRHTYASMMLSAGENIMYVAQQMGHADWSMLVKVYGQWIPSGGLQAAGSLVTAAHVKDWSALSLVLAALPAYDPRKAGDEAGDEAVDDAPEAEETLAAL